MRIPENAWFYSGWIGDGTTRWVDAAEARRDPHWRRAQWVDLKRVAEANDLFWCDECSPRYFVPPKQMTTDHTSWCRVGL